MKTNIEIPEVIKEFISAVNAHDEAALLNTFADDALAKNHLGSFWGKDAVRKYSVDDLINPKVTLEVDEVMEHYGDHMVTALADGEYPKTNAPDPTYLDYFFTVKDGKIIRMFTYLNVEKSINYKF